MVSPFFGQFLSIKKALDFSKASANLKIKDSVTLLTDIALG